jgi:hypothetical protein
MSHVYVVDGAGKIVREARVMNDPKDLVSFSSG